MSLAVPSISLTNKYMFESRQQVGEKVKLAIYLWTLSLDRE